MLVIRCRKLVPAGLFLVSACQNIGEQLYISHETTLGIDASINTATTSGSIDLGYDRRFLTWVPRSVEVGDGTNPPSDDGNNDARDVMSVLACAELRVGIVTIDYYDESLATGRAAVNFARALSRGENSSSGSDFFECFKKPGQSNDNDLGNDGDNN